MRYSKNSNTDRSIEYQDEKEIQQIYNEVKELYDMVDKIISRTTIKFINHVKPITSMKNSIQRGGQVNSHHTKTKSIVKNDESLHQSEGIGSRSHNRYNQKQSADVTQENLVDRDSGSSNREEFGLDTVMGRRKSKRHDMIREKHLPPISASPEKQDHQEKKKGRIS